MSNPPVARYRYTFEVEGNTLDEIAHELTVQANGGFMLDSDYGRRDEWRIFGGRTLRCMDHVNPNMTPERYQAELDTWWAERKAERRGNR